MVVPDNFVVLLRNIHSVKELAKMALVSKDWVQYVGWSLSKADAECLEEEGNQVVWLKSQLDRNDLPDGVVLLDLKLTFLGKFLIINA
jgi:hypothetical protein